MAPTRRGRKASRKQRKSRRTAHRGGSYLVSPADVSSSLSGSGPSMQSLGQGVQYAGFHSNQHGGNAPLSAITDSVLDQSLQGSARVLPLASALQEIQGMKDQAGGRRRKGRKASRRGKGRKASRKGKGRKASRRGKGRRTMRGGSHAYQGADLSESTMLLSNYNKAGLNPEWDLAKDPNAFAPK
jgi:hypothetical protein